ncbi:C-type lectin domain family 10 member A-like [Polypterus senegalus]|uniref:C-type lectin domain family 10 member A-like n=1 Tax=Polypterus senegalus TaxID=55291 RepID=UPI001964E3CA|nr:C-type lectin domain family 10 member A-like [Polypterus senegalus]
MASEDFYSSVVFPEKNQQPKSRIPPGRKDNVIYAEVKLKNRPGQPVEETDSDTDAEEIRTDDSQYTNYMMIDWNLVEDVKQPCGETPVVPPVNEKKKINLLTPLLMFHCALLLAAFISLIVYYVISHKYTAKEQKLQHNLSTAENKSMRLQADLNIMQLQLSDLQNQASALNWSCNELRFQNRELKQNQSELQNKTREMREKQTALLFENAKLKSNQSEQQKQYQELKDNQSELTKTQSVLLAKYQQLNDNHSKLTADFNEYCPIKDKERRCHICPDQWFYFKSKCYFFTTEAQNWHSSCKYCRALKAELVIIKSKEEQTFLIDKIKTLKKHEDKSYWIGLTDEKTEGQFQWVDNSPLDQEMAKDFWGLRGHDKGKEPDNWEGKNQKGEDCVTIQVHASHGWYDSNCKDQTNMICEADSTQYVDAPRAKSFQME